MFLAEMMSHLLEFIQNGHHSIVFISMGLYYRHHSNNCHCCFSNTTRSMESCSRWNLLLILAEHTSQYPSLVWKIWNGLASDIRFQCPIFLVVMIGFGLAPVYTGGISIMRKFSSSFRSGILFLPVFYSRLFWWCLVAHVATKHIVWHETYVSHL